MAGPASASGPSATRHSRPAVATAAAPRQAVGRPTNALSASASGSDAEPDAEVDQDVEMADAGALSQEQLPPPLQHQVDQHATPRPAAPRDLAATPRVSATFPSQRDDSAGMGVADAGMSPVGAGAGAGADVAGAGTDASGAVGALALHEADHIALDPVQQAPDSIPRGPRVTAAEAVPHASPQEGEMVFREEEVLLALQLLAYVSKYAHVRSLFYSDECFAGRFPRRLESYQRLKLHSQQYPLVDPPAEETVEATWRNDHASLSDPAREGSGLEETQLEDIPRDGAPTDNDNAPLTGRAGAPPGPGAGAGGDQQNQPGDNHTIPAVPGVAGYYGFAAALPGPIGLPVPAGKEKAADSKTGPSGRHDPAWGPRWSDPPSTARNVFSIAERYTIRSSRIPPVTLGRLGREIQFWAGVIMRNACRKDDERGGVRPCAYMACGKWESYPRQFAKCRRCRKAKYCSKQCQSLGWAAGHRFWCSARPEDEARREAHAAEATATSTAVPAPTPAAAAGVHPPAAAAVGDPREGTDGEEGVNEADRRDVGADQPILTLTHVHPRQRETDAHARRAGPPVQLPYDARSGTDETTAQGLGMTLQHARDNMAPLAARMLMARMAQRGQTGPEHGQPPHVLTGFASDQGQRHAHGRGQGHRHSRDMSAEGGPARNTGADTVHESPTAVSTRSHGRIGEITPTRTTPRAGPSAHLQEVARGEPGEARPALMNLAEEGVFSEQGLWAMEQVLRRMRDEEADASRALPGSSTDITVDATRTSRILHSEHGQPQPPSATGDTEAGREDEQEIEAEAEGEIEMGDEPENERDHSQSFVNPRLMAVRQALTSTPSTAEGSEASDDDDSAARQPAPPASGGGSEASSTLEHEGGSHLSPASAGTARDDRIRLSVSSRTELSSAPPRSTNAQTSRAPSTRAGARTDAAPLHPWRRNAAREEDMEGSFSVLSGAETDASMDMDGEPETRNEAQRGAGRAPGSETRPGTGGGGVGGVRTHLLVAPAVRRMDMTGRPLPPPLIASLDADPMHIPPGRVGTPGAVLRQIAHTAQGTEGANPTPDFEPQPQNNPFIDPDRELENMPWDAIQGYRLDTTPGSNPTTRRGDGELPSLSHPGSGLDQGIMPSTSDAGPTATAVQADSTDVDGVGSVQDVRRVSRHSLYALSSHTEGHHTDTEVVEAEPESGRTAQRLASHHHHPLGSMGARGGDSTHPSPSAGGTSASAGGMLRPRAQDDTTLPTRRLPRARAPSPFLGGAPGGYMPSPLGRGAGSRGATPARDLHEGPSGTQDSQSLVQHPQHGWQSQHDRHYDPDQDRGGHEHAQGQGQTQVEGDEEEL